VSASGRIAYAFLQASRRLGRRRNLQHMARRQREILEHAVRTVAEQAVKADELVDEARPPVEAIIRSPFTRRCSASSS